MTSPQTHDSNLVQWIATMCRATYHNSSRSSDAVRRILPLLMVGGFTALISGCSDSVQSVARDEATIPASPVMVPAASNIADASAGHPSDQPLIDEEVTLHLHAPTAKIPPDARPKLGRFALPSEPELKIGDRAPELAVKQWVHGSSNSSSGASFSVQVITFWATWSEPSIEAIGRFPILQNRFGNDVQFVAVSSETAEAVTGFLNTERPVGNHQWKEFLSFPIAADHRGDMEGQFLLASFEQALPTSFVVDSEGRVAWIGPADQVEPVIAKVLAGSWDLDAARKSHELVQARKAAQREIRERLALARVSNDGDECIRLIDELLEAFPDDVDFQMLRFQYQLRFEMAAAANEQAMKLLNQLRDDSRRLNQLAWCLAEHASVPDLDLSIAHEAASLAVELTKESDASSLETLARVQFRRGDVDGAIETQAKAVELAPASRNLADTLEAFRKSSPSPIKKVGFYGALM